MRDLFVLMASYNAWMNDKLYKTAQKLSPEELHADKGAFFGSVMGTLNHILVGDRIWLQRFAEHPSRPEALNHVRLLPKPQALNEILFTDFREMSAHRAQLDAAIVRWAQELTDLDLDQVLCFTTLKGTRVCKRFADVVVHFFNHQTHHRGQTTTLLSQFGQDVGVTDLLALVSDKEETS